MAVLKNYKIRYKNGNTQEVEAEGTRTTKEFIYFEVDGSWVHQVAADSVESLGLASVPDPQMPEVEVGQFSRAGRARGI